MSKENTPDSFNEDSDLWRGSQSKLTLKKERARNQRSRIHGRRTCQRKSKRQMLVPELGGTKEHGLFREQEEACGWITSGVEVSEIGGEGVE